MLKKNLKRVSALAFAAVAFASTSASAQVAEYWGYGTTNDPTNGQFAQAFVNAPAVLVDTTWNAISVYQDSGSSAPIVKPGNAYWVRTLNGYGQGAYTAASEAISSATVADGAAIFDSDYLDNGGVVGAFGQGAAPRLHKGILVSPKIDLSSAAGTNSLSVEFNSQYRRNFLIDLSVGISLDNGATWVDKDYRSLQAELSDDRVSVPFINILQGATSLNNVRIRFTFAGSYYFATVDDVTIKELPNHDLAAFNLDENTTTGSFFRAGGSTRPGNAYIMPEGFFKHDGATVDQTAWFWGARVINRGAATVDSGAAKLHIGIDFRDSSGSWIADVYRDSVVLDEVVAGQATSDFYIDNEFSNLDFIKNNTSGPNGSALGTYRVRYYTEMDSVDRNNVNDTLVYSFIVSEGTYSRVGRAGSDGKPSSDGALSIGTFASTDDAPYSKYEVASVYYFPNMGSNYFLLDSISTRFYAYSSYNGPTDLRMFVNIYEYNDGSNGQAADGVVNGAGDELTQLAIALDTLKGVKDANGGTRYNVLTTSNFRKSVQVPGAPIAYLDTLFSNKFYVVSYEQNANIAGANLNNDPSGVYNMVNVAGDANFNMSCNMLLSDSGRVQGSHEMHRHFAVTPGSNTYGSDWRWTGGYFGAASVSTALYGRVEGLVSSVEETTVKTSFNANLYPTLATTQVNMDVEFEEATNVQYIVTDVSGRVINVVSAKNVITDTVAFDVSSLAQGVYFITARTDANTVTKRFVKK